MGLFAFAWAKQLIPGRPIYFAYGTALLMLS
jgi:hypothetical protein